MYLICNNSGEYFTAGKKYFVMDFGKDWFLVSDDDNRPHYLSGEFAVKNFKEVMQ